MLTLQLIKTTPRQAAIDILACSGCLVIFGLLISWPVPVKWAGGIPLLIAGYFISRNITITYNRTTFNLTRPANQRLLLYCFSAVWLGLAGSFYYRVSFSLPLLPVYFRTFCLVAVSIGLMEELLFRGFVQTRFQTVSPYWAIFVAALAHASYKSALFLSPVTAGITPIWLFFSWSFLAFILLGALRHWSGSLWPPVLVHVIFDLLVYAENNEAPVWIW